MCVRSEGYSLEELCDITESPAKNIWDSDKKWRLTNPLLAPLEPQSRLGTKLLEI